MNRNIIEYLKWKKLVRILAYPIVQLYRKLLIRKYQSSEDARYIKSLKGIHSGESCFVIGNGPSLTAEDLNVLQSSEIPSFASNRIYQIFSQTEWRPTYYMCVDVIFAYSNFDKLRISGEYPKFIDYHMKKLGREPKDNIHYICNYSKFTIDLQNRVPQELSSDLSLYSTQTGTVTVNAIELAIHMGFKTIYLLGVDNNYKHKRRPDGTIYVDTTVDKSYFVGGEPDKSEGVSVQLHGMLEKSYEVTKAFAEKSGVKIYNATRGGKLEVFERVDFDEVFVSRGRK